MRKTLLKIGVIAALVASSLLGSTMPANANGPDGMFVYYDINYSPSFGSSWPIKFDLRSDQPDCVSGQYYVWELSYPKYNSASSLGSYFPNHRHCNAIGVRSMNRGTTWYWQCVKYGANTWGIPAFGAGYNDRYNDNVKEFGASYVPQCPLWS